MAEQTAQSSTRQKPRQHQTARAPSDTYGAYGRADQPVDEKRRDPGLGQRERQPPRVEHALEQDRRALSAGAEPHTGGPFVTNVTGPATPCGLGVCQTASSNSESAA